jgi:hypothetical protein
MLLFDSSSSTEEPHILWKLSASCARFVQLRAPPPHGSRA